MRTIQIVDGDDPFFTMKTMGKDNDKFDLTTLNFFFAIEQIDPRVGSI